MNKVVLIGRLTKDPEVRWQQVGDTQEKFAYANYTLAVNRTTKDSNGNYLADFIRCEAAGKTAEFAEKYLHKGTKVGVSGQIRTGSYTNKDGQTVYTTVVLVNEHEFCEKKADNGNDNAFPSQTADGFTPIPDGVTDEELPFA